MATTDLERAWSRVDENRLRDLIVRMVSTPSPTGDEAPLARDLTGYLAAHGLDATYQEIDSRQGNAVGRLRGDGTGADLLLYAPIDTVSTGTAEEDLPYVGDALRPDMRNEGLVDGDTVIGLGASNPKGHAACVIEAAIAIAAAGLPLRGDLLVGLGAGGMPTNSRPGAARNNTGQGNGCSFLLEQGVWADHAILAKPGWSVSHEEVGLCWFTVRVHGTYNYVGSRQRLPYRNAVVDAARLIGELEKWFPVYTARNTGGLVAPQGHVAAIRGGWPRTAAFSPAVCEFDVDLRLSPRTTPVDAARQFTEGLTEALARLGDVEATWRMTLSIPGSHTDPDTWIVGACVRAFEAVTGQPHVIDEVYRTTSGATDGNILRNRGIPTARIGMPRLSLPDGSSAGGEVDFPMGMNAASLTNMVALTRLLVAAAVDACTRDRSEIGGLS